MCRTAGWLLAAVLLIGAHVLTDGVWRALCLIGALLIFGWLAGAVLRRAILALGLVAASLAIAFGAGVLLDTLPALIAALVAWLFARTLRAGRRPLIARAISVLDGQARLHDPQVARYARRLTWVWAIWQCVLGAVGALIAIHAHAHWPDLPIPLPSPLVYETLVLPLAVAMLFVGEYVARPRLLPQAPRHSLGQFIKHLLQAWSQLIED